MAQTLKVTEKQNEILNHSYERIAQLQRFEVAVETRFGPLGGEGRGARGGHWAAAPLNSYIVPPWLQLPQTSKFPFLNVYIL